MDKHNKGCIGGIYIKPKNFEILESPYVEFHGFNILNIKTENSSFGGIEITNNTEEQED